MINHQTITESKQPQAFEAAARSAVQSVRQAISEVLLDLGVDPRSPQSISRQLGLERNLVWRTSRVVVEEDAFTAVRHLPGASALRTLLKSFEKAGARPESVQAVSQAMAAFDQMVETHAGDRETFDRMITSLPGEGQGERDEAMRRLAFQGNSAIWGIEAKVRLSVQVLTPSDSPERLDLTAISGMAGFRWLRPTVPWPVFARRYLTDDGKEIAPTLWEPLDPASRKDNEPPLWREFCSGATPMHRSLGADGVARYELVGGLVGNTGQCTCINAWTDRAALSRWCEPGRRVGEHSVWFSTPVALLMFDLYVHRSITMDVKPSIHVLSQLPGGPGGDQRMCEIPVADRAVELSGPFDLTTPELPVYPRMMAKVFAHVKQDASEFTAFRFRLRYPPIAARAMYRYELPESP